MRPLAPRSKVGPTPWFAVLAWLVLAPGCGDATPPTADADPAPLESEVRMARALFEEQLCSMCHGDEAEGTQGGPALVDLAPYWNVERLSDYLEDPQAFREAHPDFEDRRDIEYEQEMPAFDNLSLAQRRLLARWLLTRTSSGTAAP